MNRCLELFISRLLGSALAVSFCTIGVAATGSPADFVDPMVGTDAHGHAYPGATVPFGMVQLSPDTRIDSWDGCSGYHYSDSTILGFSHTHLAGTGCGCMGDIMLMPAVGDVRLEDPQSYASPFSHKREVAKAGYYRVFLEKPQVTAELTASARAGFHRYSFPAGANSHIVLDLLHGIQNDATATQLTVENSTTLSGFRKSNGWGGRRTAYFVIKLSRPFDSIQILQDGQTMPDGTTSAKGLVKALLNYKTTAGQQILVRVGISATGEEGARKNLAAEIPAWDFSATRRAAEKQWNDALGVVQAESADPHVCRTFYTNLYLSYQAPTLFNDVDGSYFGSDHKIHTDGGFQNYTTFSLWDTHRALHPLLTILQPQRIDDFVNTMLAEYREYGQHTTPIWPLWGNETWCMIGYHSVPVMVDAYLKGFRGFDAETAYQAMRDTAMQNRSGLDTYKKLGWVASRGGASAASKTLEYAVDDWCLAKMAEALGHTDDAQMFYARAANYRNLFDGTSRLMRGRKADGSWRAPFDTHGLVGDEYTEADAWQYAFYAPQDVPGLVSLYGGDEGFVKRMDQLFAENSVIHTNIPDISGLIGQYSQGDEQCHHVAYLYDYAGAAWKTQERVRQVMATQYNDTPAGQCGNVDCGQMSAWFVFSALGMYPVNPGAGVYALGSPLVDKAVIHLDAKKYHGATFTILAQNNGPKNVYIESASLNGKPLTRSWISHKELTAGGTLKFVMGSKPNTSWAQAIADRPAPTMPSDFHYAALPAPADDRPVVLTLPIRVICGSSDAVQGFVPDPNMLDGATNQADSNNSIDTSAASHPAPAEVYQSERYGSDFTYHFTVPKNRAYTVRLHFAELFDEAAGMRREDVLINGNTVLKNFDTFTQAGGLNKATVREFKAIRPDANGVISIQIKAVPDSPDQNAKISGIEILP